MRPISDTELLMQIRMISEVDETPGISTHRLPKAAVARHDPSGWQVRCSVYEDSLTNKMVAMDMLIAKLKQAAARHPEHPTDEVVSGVSRLPNRTLAAASQLLNAQTRISGVVLTNVDTGHMAIVDDLVPGAITLGNADTVRKAANRGIDWGGKGES